MAASVNEPKPLARAAFFAYFAVRGMRYPAPFAVPAVTSHTHQRSPLLSRFRLLFTFLAIFALAAALAACGGDDGGSEDEDPQKVLDQTFSGDNESVDSGDLSFSVNVEATGVDGGSLDAEVSGPFDTQGDETKVPKFDLSASFDVQSDEDDVNFDGGLVSTGDAAFVNYKGSDYEVDQALFDQFKQSVEQAAGQQEDEQSNQALDALGIEDPESLLTNLTNEGTADVEGTETTHISGDLDVDRSIDALKNVLGNASALGALGGGTQSIPEPEELDQVADAIKEASFDVYSGTDDNILRRLQITLAIESQDEPGTVDLGLDFTLAGVNESQAIKAPSGAKPFNDFLSEIGVDGSALGALGALGSGGALGGGSGGGSQTAPALPGSTPDADAAQEYLNCVAEAQSAADLQACADLAPSP